MEEYNYLLSSNGDDMRCKSQSCRTIHPFTQEEKNKNVRSYYKNAFYFFCYYSEIPSKQRKMHQKEKEKVQTQYPIFHGFFFPFFLCSGVNLCQILNLECKVIKYCQYVQKINIRNHAYGYLIPYNCLSLTSPILYMSRRSIYYNYDLQ